MKAEARKGSLHPKFIVGIGGSAGALDAYKAFFDALPHKTDMAFVIISHMGPSAHSELALILSNHTKMPVIVASMKMPIRKNYVYVIPNDTDLLIENYTFNVLSPRSVGNKQIDLFFISLAEAMATRAVGIILSGYDGDGTEGCKHIKAKGGITFTQDDSAEVPHMPQNAQASGCIDYVLSPGKMAGKLNRISMALKI